MSLTGSHEKRGIKKRDKRKHVPEIIHQYHGLSPEDEKLIRQLLRTDNGLRNDPPSLRTPSLPSQEGLSPEDQEALQLIKLVDLTLVPEEENDGLFKPKSGADPTWVTDGYISDASSDGATSAVQEADVARLRWRTKCKALREVIEKKIEQGEYPL